ncbi:hypothetical protein ACFP81_09805 [Deinococcus lacus]|uniref:Uncharacterized protein n=1 Tax=Deinococcus lacus TaxID=392561 RepID=A0ABW1YGA6_9DEIO
MDFNSWRPEDTARRYSIMVGASLGTFTFLGLWLAAEQNILVAILGGLAAALLLFFILYPVIRAVYSR